MPMLASCIKMEQKQETKVGKVIIELTKLEDAPHARGHPPYDALPLTHNWSVVEGSLCQRKYISAASQYGVSLCQISAIDIYTATAESLPSFFWGKCASSGV